MPGPVTSTTDVLTLYPLKAHSPLRVVADVVVVSGGGGGESRHHVSGKVNFPLLSERGDAIRIKHNYSEKMSKDSSTFSRIPVNSGAVLRCLTVSRIPLVSASIC